MFSKMSLSFSLVFLFQTGLAQLVYPPYAVPSLYYPAVATGWVWGSNKGGDQEPIQGHISSPFTNGGGPIPSPLGEEQPMPPKMSPPMAPPAMGPPPPLSPSTPAPARAPAQSVPQGSMPAPPQFPPMPSPKPVDLKEFPKMSTTTSRPH
ncbi:unnamed protein product [Bursaphelenchus xylophilus]|uniref:(pine wood nematode) hypothetical protein n=1 Tax=Bursaphelenchus xylophilus TaxID=6326 RepID=A0A1I7RND0_BURXY|nr:unnamed protein product [Bursaphelenchus xylophilus]CAG9123889.1 unnamed protein product [Bursaphelenchus xylophilus]